MSNNKPEHVLAKIDQYYSAKLREHGATPRGVDWNSNEAQELRFAQIYKLIDGSASPSIIDYGCGYGAFSQYVLRRLPTAHIVGFDVSRSMITAARSSLGTDSRCSFTSDSFRLRKADYVVASGIFSVRMDVGVGEWEEYIDRTIANMSALSTRGFAFNVLTSYSDPEKMREDLYYGNPHRFFDLCRERFSRNVAILHDYGLYEFTVHVRY